MAHQGNKLKRSPSSVIISPHDVESFTLPSSNSVASPCFPPDTAAIFGAQTGNYLVDPLHGDFRAALQFADLFNMSGSPHASGRIDSQLAFGSPRMLSPERIPVIQSPQVPKEDLVPRVSGEEVAVSPLTGEPRVFQENVSRGPEDLHRHETNTLQADVGTKTTLSSAATRTAARRVLAPGTVRRSIYDDTLDRILEDEYAAFTALEDSKEEAAEFVNQQLTARSRIKSALNAGHGDEKHRESDRDGWAKQREFREAMGSKHFGVG